MGLRHRQGFGARKGSAHDERRAAGRASGGARRPRGHHRSAVAFVPATDRAGHRTRPPPLAQAAPPAGQPLTGDFDGDGRVDIFWYGPGSAPDHHWYGQSNLQFGGRPIAINRTYQPIIGDFDGDRRSDIFWYAPARPATSSTTAPAATASPARRPWSRAPTSPSRATSTATAAPTSSGRRRVGHRLVWYGAPGRTFVHRGFTVNRTLTPLVGDYNGDFRHDIFGTAPARSPTRSGTAPPPGASPARPPTSAAPTSPWSVTSTATGAATSSGTRRGRRATRCGTAPPAARSPARRSPSTARWCHGSATTTATAVGTSSGTPPARTPTRSGTAPPPGASPAGPPTPSALYQPVTGDFNGGGRTDVFWWAPGTGDDAVWFATASRSFTGRPTTIDLAYERPTPLQPQSLVDAYNPYGYIAHAAGGYDGRTYTNSLDAFEFNYARGFRVFELDFVVLADGTVLAAHNGLERYYGLTKPFDQASWAEIAGNKFDGRYTIMRSNEVVQLAARPPRRLRDPRHQVPARPHLPALRVPDRRRPRAHGPGAAPHQGPGRARPVPERLAAAELHDRPLPHAGLQQVRRPRGRPVHQEQPVAWRDDVVAGPRSARSLSQNHVQGRRFTPTFAGQVQAAARSLPCTPSATPPMCRPSSPWPSACTRSPFAVSGQRAAEEQPLVDPVFPPGVVPVRGGRKAPGDEVEPQEGRSDASRPAACVRLRSTGAGAAAAGPTGCGGADGHLAARSDPRSLQRRSAPRRTLESRDPARHVRESRS